MPYGAPYGFPPYGFGCAVAGRACCQYVRTPHKELVLEATTRPKVGSFKDTPAQGPSVPNNNKKNPGPL